MPSVFAGDTEILGRETEDREEATTDASLLPKQETADLATSSAVSTVVERSVGCFAIVGCNQFV